jgi:hypothetical protein
MAIEIANEILRTLDRHCTAIAATYIVRSHFESKI